MDNSIVIRKARPADLVTLRGFEAKLVEHERAVVPELKQLGKIEYYPIEKFLKSKNVLFLIAEVDGVPAGCGFGQIKKSDPWYTHEQYGYIGLMYVDESQRGKNIGGQIIQSLISWFKKKEIKDVHLKVYSKNHSAIRAYEKYGFTNFGLEMKIDL